MAINWRSCGIGAFFDHIEQQPHEIVNHIEVAFQVIVIHYLRHVAFGFCGWQEVFSLLPTIRQSSVNRIVLFLLESLSSAIRPKITVRGTPFVASYIEVETVVYGVEISVGSVATILSRPVPKGQVPFTGVNGAKSLGIETDRFSSGTRAINGLDFA